jgi:hypothetical protein
VRPGCFRRSCPVLVRLRWISRTFDGGTVDRYRQDFDGCERRGSCSRRAPRWYPTDAGRRLVRRERLGMLRHRARQARRQMIEKIARAEALYAFADTLTHPALRPALVPAPRAMSRSWRHRVPAAGARPHAATRSRPLLAAGRDERQGGGSCPATHPMPRSKTDDLTAV